MESADVTILVGSEAEAWLSHAENIAAWESLRVEFGCNNPYLSTAFCTVWYSAYGHKYKPVLALGYTNTNEFEKAEESENENKNNGENALTCVMPLAIADNNIVFAGANQAEYQGWLCDPDSSRNFFRIAQDHLGTLFPNSTFVLRYVMKGENCDVLEWMAEANRSCTFHAFKRPLLDVKSDTAKKSLKKKSNKSKINRLKRQGELTVRRVTSVEEFDELMPTVFEYYDLRQGATHNICPFTDDSDKFQFHRDWYLASPESFTISVLMLGEAPVSLFFGINVRDSVSNAIVAHHPKISPFSGSKIHIYMLSAELEDTDIHYLDQSVGWHVEYCKTRACWYRY